MKIAKTAAATAVTTLAALLAGLGPATGSAQVISPEKVPRGPHFNTTAVLDLGPDNVQIAGSDSHDPGNGTVSAWQVKRFDGTTWSRQGRGPMGFGELDAIDAVSPADVWAVGAGGTGEVAAHFDGTAWTQVSTPTIQGSGTQGFAGVSALSASDAWAVGSYIYEEGHTLPLTEHWNGHAWRIVPDPVVGTSDLLYGVAAVSANDVWAVGSTDAGGLIEHWNGHKWTVALQGGPRLRAVTEISPDDIWAVSDQAGNAAVSMHWDGSTWTAVPMARSHAHELFDSVSGVAGDDIWAVGSAGNGLYGQGYAVIEHWDGTRWRVVPSSVDGGAAIHWLTGVSAAASDDVWAVGFTGQFDDGHQLVLHWDGSSWTSVRVGK